MTPALPSPSGLPDIDHQWGGLAAGGAYLLVGRAGAGRSALALQTVRAAVEADERCLVISPRPPESLVEVGREVGLDLAAAHQAGSLRLLRIPTAATLAERGSDGLTASYRDLAGLVARDRPGRVVVEDFTPLVQFDTFERFQDAFSTLVEELRAQGTTLVIGLGDPANDASRRLLDVVEGLVDGTVRLGAGGDLTLSVPAGVGYPSSDGASVEAGPPVAPAPPDPAPDAGGPDAEGEAEPAAESPGSTGVPRPGDPGSQPLDHTPAPPDTSTHEAHAPDGGFETTFSESGPPADDAAPLAPTGSASGPLPTAVIPPPPADPSLLADGADPSGQDPADALFEQGFLADSGRQPAAAAAPAAPPAPPPWAQGPQASPAGVPPFTPLASLAPLDPRAAFHTALDDAFAARASGTPFLVVALRVDPAAPAAAHFDAVEAGLRSSLRPGDRVLVDAARRRAAAVLPAAASDDGQALLTGLQAYLRARLDGSAEDALQSVAAATIVNGQPFQTPADLLAFAVDG